MGWIKKSPIKTVVLLILGLFVLLGIVANYPFIQCDWLHLCKNIPSVSEIDAIRNREFPLAGMDNGTNKKRNYEKEFYCEFKNNVGHTECLIEKLDRASAIREWKQKKLETIKHPEVNVYELTPDLKDEVATMQRWRKSFEIGRDNQCTAEQMFRSGSGTPGAIAECELNHEISALKILDDIYYDTVLNFVNGSKGILDFEPTEKDIQYLMKTNATSRGCVWAGEKECQ